MTNPQAARVAAKPYDHWTIAVHVYGSVFEHVRGELSQIDREASSANLNRLSTNTLLGAFPGADVTVFQHEEVGPTLVTVGAVDDNGQVYEPTGPMSEDVQTRSKRLLQNLYQRMDWLIARSVQLTPAPITATPDTTRTTSGWATGIRKL